MPTHSCRTIPCWARASADWWFDWLRAERWWDRWPWPSCCWWRACRRFQSASIDRCVRFCARNPPSCSGNRNWLQTWRRRHLISDIRVRHSENGKFFIDFPDFHFSDIFFDLILKEREIFVLKVESSSKCFLGERLKVFFSFHTQIWEIKVRLTLPGKKGRNSENEKCFRFGKFIWKFPNQPLKVNHFLFFRRKKIATKICAFLMRLKKSIENPFKQE